MKTAITPAYTFAPIPKTLDLSAVAGFDIKRLMGVVNATTGAILYAPGLPGLGYTTLSGAVLTLAASTAGMASTDKLVIVYDDGTAAASEAGIAAVHDIVALGVGLPVDTGWGGSGSGSAIAILKAIWTKLGSVVLAAGTAVIGKVGLQVAGSDVAVGNPIPAQERGAQGAIPISALDSPVVAGRLFAVICTVKGNVAVTMADGSTYTVPVSLGFQAFPFAVTQVNASGTTATATYANLK